MSGSIFELFNSEELECKRKNIKSFSSEYEDFTIVAIVKIRTGWRAERNGELIEGGITLHVRPNELLLNDLVNVDDTWYRVSGISRGKDFTIGDEFDRITLGAEGMESEEGQEIAW